MLRDISFSPDMREACRIARLERMRAEQDRLFELNMRIKQKMAGVAICLLSIAGWWFLSEVYGQFELGLFVPCFLSLGFYMLLTDKLISE